MATLSEKLLKIFIFISVTVFTLYFAPAPVSFIPSESDSNALAQLRVVVTYHCFIAAIIALGVFTRGKVNRFIAIWLVFALVVEYVIFYNWHAMATTTYGHNLAGTVSVLVAYLLVSHRVLMTLTFAKWMSHWTAFRSIASRIAVLAQFTDLEMLAIRYKLMFVYLELTTMLYCFWYLWQFDVPANGSLYGTIIENGHFDYQVLHQACSDLLLVYWIFIVSYVLLKERKAPDSFLGQSLGRK